MQQSETTAPTRARFLGGFEPDVPHGAYRFCLLNKSFAARDLSYFISAQHGADGG